MDEINAMAADDYLYRVPAKPLCAGISRSFESKRRQPVPGNRDRSPAGGRRAEAAGSALVFDRIFTCTEFGVGKDRPDIFFAAMEFLGGVQGKQHGL